MFGHKQLHDAVSQQRNRQDAAKGIQNALNCLDVGEAGDQALHGIIVDLNQTICTFCGGRGHPASYCATKKNIDASLKRTNALRKQWGLMKGSVKAESSSIGIKRSCNEAFSAYEAQI